MPNLSYPRYNTAIRASKIALLHVSAISGALEQRGRAEGGLEPNPVGMPVERNQKPTLPASRLRDAGDFRRIRVVFFKKEGVLAMMRERRGGIRASVMITRVCF